MKRTLLAVGLAVLTGCATPGLRPSPPSAVLASGAQISRQPVKLVVQDQRPGSDARLSNQLEGYVRNELEKLGVKVDPSATQTFEVNAMPPSGRCAAASGRVFTADAEAFALSANAQQCSNAPGNQLLVADYVIGSVVNALEDNNAPGRSDFQRAVDAVVAQLVLKLR